MLAWVNDHSRAPALVHSRAVQVKESGCEVKPGSVDVQAKILQLQFPFGSAYGGLCVVPHNNGTPYYRL